MCSCLCLRVVCCLWPGLGILPAVTLRKCILLGMFSTCTIGVDTGRYWFISSHPLVSAAIMGRQHLGVGSQHNSWFKCVFIVFGISRSSTRWEYGMLLESRVSRRYDCLSDGLTDFRGASSSTRVQRVCHDWFLAIPVCEVSKLIVLRFLWNGWW